jgi:hypothetical protein
VLSVSTSKLSVHSNAVLTNSLKRLASLRLTGGSSGAAAAAAAAAAVEGPEGLVGLLESVRVRFASFGLQHFEEVALQLGQLGYQPEDEWLASFERWVLVFVIKYLRPVCRSALNPWSMALRNPFNTRCGCNMTCIRHSMAAVRCGSPQLQFSAPIVLQLLPRAHTCLCVVAHSACVLWRTLHALHHGAAMMAAMPGGSPACCPLSCCCVHGAEPGANLNHLSPVTRLCIAGTPWPQCQEAAPACCHGCCWPAASCLAAAAQRGARRA